MDVKLNLYLVKKFVLATCFSLFAVVFAQGFMSLLVAFNFIFGETISVVMYYYIFVMCSLCIMSFMFLLRYNYFRERQGVDIDG